MSKQKEKNAEIEELGSPHTSDQEEAIETPSSPIVKPKKKLSEKQLESLAKGRARRALLAKQKAAQKREQEAKELRKEVRERRKKPVVIVEQETESESDSEEEQVVVVKKKPRPKPAPKPKKAPKKRIVCSANRRYETESETSSQRSSEEESESEEEFVAPPRLVRHPPANLKALFR